MHLVYREAARVLAEAETSPDSLRTLLYRDKARLGLHWRCVYALTLQTYRYNIELKRVVDDALQQQSEAEQRWWQSWLERAGHRWLLRVALYELLHGHGKLLRARGLVMKKIKALLSGSGGVSMGPASPMQPELFKDTELAFRFFWLQKQQAEVDQYSLEQAFPNCIERDADFPDHIWRYRGNLTTFLSHPWIRQMRLVIQDKGSCMAALAVQPQSSWHVIDACAAPGNKSMFLASMLQGEGMVSAFERDSQRYRSMVQRVRRARLNRIIRTFCWDFLAVGAKEDTAWADAQAILLDPSCTGSGMVDQRPLGERYDQERVRRLADVQRSLLRHALSAFPQVQRVIYSTCSILREENEQVVEDMLADPELASHWALETLFPSWPHRGLMSCRAAVRVPAWIPEGMPLSRYGEREALDGNTFDAPDSRERFISRSAYFIAAFRRCLLPSPVQTSLLSDARAYPNFGS
jgi:16S rRNA C967 or C1407 C5-methylase (RsmB/RsmF family)